MISHESPEGAGRGLSEEPIEVGWYAYSGGAQQMVFHLRETGQWSVHLASGDAADCTWSYIEQALGVWNLVRIDPAIRAEHVDTALAEVERLRAEHRAFTGRLGFGDGQTEPAATLEQMVESIEQAFSEASEYREGPRICEPCGEWLATQVCEHCYGSGCGPGTATGAYDECEWCAGVGKVHPGCVEVSYADLAAERDRLLAQVAAVAALAEEWEAGANAWGTCGHEWMSLRQFRAALDDPAPVLAQAKAEAWDEGYRAGVNDEQTSQDWTGGTVPPARQNPYRGGDDASI